jgi:hypothetical protein
MKYLVIESPLHKMMYELRDKLQSKSKYIKLNIKCNSTQQCSFNKFNTFLKEEKKRQTTARSQMIIGFI